MKYFTPAEADAVIPELEKIFGAVDDDHAGAAIERSQLQFLASAINEWMRKIVELGALPKGVSPALVDFPSRVDGAEAYLCWKLGEKRVSHFHPVDEGFSTRKPLAKRRCPPPDIKA